MDRRTNGTVHITPPPLSSQAMADLLCTLMLLIHGNHEDGGKFWAYLCIKPSMARAFKEASDRDDFHPEDYGTIIESGEGNDVPEEIARRMELQYGVNHEYEANLFRSLAALQPV